tara:strand:+ start:1183 stop:1563 length:381 start_codon:yes stop_codon:yes gene_type:complete
MNPFDFLNAINHTKKDVMVDDITEKAYPAFLINRSLSYFPDTVAFANELNMNHHLDSKLQFHFYLNTLRKRKRFSKWDKPDSIRDIEAVKEYYQYSDEKAKVALTILTDNQIKSIRERIKKGGRKK